MSFFNLSQSVFKAWYIIMIALSGMGLFMSIRLISIDNNYVIGMGTFFILTGGLNLYLLMKVDKGVKNESVKL